MDGIAESSSSPLKNDKPVVVRVKRKASQSCLDALWLEINERPLKRPLLDFDKLSISDSSKKDQELKTRKVFVRHVETVTTADVTTDILQSFVSTSSDAVSSKEKSADVRRAFKTENVSSRNARFEQIWKSSKEKEDFMHDGRDDMCRLYDVVRVDVEEKSKVDRLLELEDCKMMSEFLPLLKEFIPSAAEEVEADIYDSLSERGRPDNYVYDYYAMEDGMEITEEDAANLFPLVQVDDDDTFYDGPDDSEDESYDSNAENNAFNEYPDEESSDNDDQLGDGLSANKSETQERSSDAESEGDDDSHSQGSGSGSSEAEKYGENVRSDGDSDHSYEDEVFYSYEDIDDDHVE